VDSKPGTCGAAKILTFENPNGYASVTAKRR
jgi:hypothetical protein